MDSRPVIIYADSPVWSRLTTVVRIMQKVHEVEQLGLSRDIVDTLIDELEFEDGTPAIFSMQVLGAQLVGLSEQGICEQVHVVTPHITIPIEFRLDSEEQAGIH